MEKKHFPAKKLVLFFISIFFMAVGIVIAQNPLPVLNSISPDTKVQHLPTFTLTAVGSDFIQTSVIVFNGVTKPTFYVDATQLTCTIDPNDILVPAGQPDLVVPVLVRNPAPGGGDSNSIDFNIRSCHTFTDIVGVSDTSDYSFVPQVEVDNQGIVHVAWNKNVGNSSIVRYRRSTDNGTTWGPILNISPSTWSFCSLNSISMVEQPDSKVFVFFRRNLPGVNRMYYCHSSDHGATWGPTNLVMESPNILPELMRTDSAGNFLALGSAMWLGAYDMFFGFSQDKGVTWPIRTNISINAGTSRWSDMDLAINGDIHVAWQDDTPGQYRVFYSRSSNNGANFIPPIPIINSLQNWNIEVETGRLGEVYIFWSRSSLQPPWLGYLFMSYSNNNGANFTAAVGRQIYPGNLRDKELCVDIAGNINHVASVEDSSSLFYSWFSRSIDGGATWSGKQVISPLTSYTDRLDMTLDRAGNIYIVWDNYGTNPDPGSQIYFCRSHH